MRGEPHEYRGRDLPGGLWEGRAGVNDRIALDGNTAAGEAPWGEEPQRDWDGETVFGAHPLVTLTQRLHNNIQREREGGEGAVRWDHQV